MSAPIRVPEPPGGWAEPWPRLFEIAAAVPTEGWMLIGGLMVQAHGLAAGIDVVRPTVDVDMIVLAQLRPDPFGATVQQLRDLGYEFRLPMGDGPAHRFVREQAQVDVGLPDHL